ncbi:MAG: hypothetical protein OXD54_15720 [Candidatus Poribacteria bacterium]|nr:hypothetical protein [Candidatus Poribacteria bacterium]
MKTTISAILTLLILMFLPYAIAETRTQINLPEGATARLGKGVTKSITFSPDNTQLAVHTTIGIWLYDTDTAELLNLFRVDTHFFPESITFSPDGDTIASSNRGNQVRLWNVATGEILHTLIMQGGGWITDVQFTTDGKKVASFTNREPSFIGLWDTATGKDLHGLMYNGQIVSIAISSDSKKIVGTSSDQTTQVWDIITGEHLHSLNGHKDIVGGAAFSPDGHIIATRSDDTTIRLWDANTGEHLHTLLGHTKRVGEIVFSVPMATTSSVRVMTQQSGYGIQQQVNSSTPLKDMRILSAH